jgi:hypothetical protein
MIVRGHGTDLVRIAVSIARPVHALHFRVKNNIIINFSMYIGITLPNNLLRKVMYIALELFFWNSFVEESH